MIEYMKRREQARKADQALRDYYKLKKSIHMEKQEVIESYTKHGVLRDKIEFVYGAPCFNYNNVQYMACAYDKLDVRKINESNGIVICSETYGLPIWRYAYVKTVFECQREMWFPKKSTSLDITKADIENKIGYEIEDMKLEPKYENGHCIGLDVTVRPKVAVDHIEVNFKVEDPDLKYVCMYFYSCAGMISVYESDSTGLKLREIGGAMNRLDADKIVSNHFPEYEVIETGGDGIKHMLTLRCKPKNDYDWNIGDFRLVKQSDNLWYIRSTNPDGDVTVFSGNSIDSVVEQLEKAMERKGFVVDGRKIYKGHIYYTVKKKEPALEWEREPWFPKEQDWRIGSYYFKHAGTTVNPYTLGYEKCYMLMTFNGYPVDGKSYTFQRVFDVFLSDVCNGGKYDVKCIDDIAYYKPKLSEPKPTKETKDWRIGSYFVSNTGNKCSITKQDMFILNQYGKGNVSVSGWFVDILNILYQRPDMKSGYDTKCIDGIIYYKPKR